MTQKEMLLEALYNRDEIDALLEVSRFIDSEAWAQPEKFTDQRRESVEKAQRAINRARSMLKINPTRNLIETAKRIHTSG